MMMSFSPNEGTASSDVRLNIHKKETIMSKVGTIVVDVYSVYDEKSLKAFAKKAGVTTKQAESIARERLYRMEYNRRRNLLPEVKEERRVYHARRRELAKMLNAAEL
jgi:hypothetical protein